MFKLNFKIALRSLWKNKGFSLINIGGLAVGLACCLMLMLYVNYEWGYDRQYQNLNNIYIGKLNLLFNGKVATTGALPYPLDRAIQQEIPGIKRAAKIEQQRGDKLFAHGEHKFKFKSYYVDPNIAEILSVKFIQGNAEHAFNGPNSIVLTKNAAHKLFGTDHALGKSLKWDNQQELMVSAVIDDLPKNQSFDFEVLHPWSFYEQTNPEIKAAGWGSINCSALFQLREDADIDQVNAVLKNFIVNKDPNLKAYVYEPFLFPLAKNHLYNEFEDGKLVGGRIDQVRLFAGLALCVLIIACINYMNLSTARSEKRAREVGVRKALGSARSALMGQFMLESMMLSFVAMIFAFALLEVSLPYFNNLLHIVIQINYSSYLFWSILLALVLVTGAIAGSYPAFYLSSFIPVKVLKGFKGSVGSLSIRRVLVVFQFTLSVCIIISAIFVYNQIQFMKNKPLAFDQQHMVEIALDGQLKNESKLQLFKERLINEGAIVAATEFASPFTQHGSITGDVSWPGKSLNDKSIINYRSTGFNFTKTIGAQMVQGRDFSPKFIADTSTSILLNEAAVKLMGLKNPVGTKIIWGDNLPLTVVGVVKDFFNTGVAKEVQPTLFYYNVKTSKILLLRLNPEQSLSKSIADIKAASQALNPAYPLELSFISAGMEEKLQDERLMSVLSNVFGGFAIFISCLGLLGLALYMAEQRNKEISIRKVLGANMADILVLLNKDFLKLVAISNIIAIPVAYIVVNKWLQKYDFKTAINYQPFLLAICASLLIAIITVSLQSFKVAKANAVDALKYE
ncbi:MAG: FtsX-like permease family protein [Pedobacter sp.]|nr:FtsX-like permease family protein [Pedobacter sp.]MDQ8053273.1 FtsX-like permease family protein [Pedobacter sp.]